MGEVEKAGGREASGDSNSKEVSILRIPKGDEEVHGRFDEGLKLAVEFEASFLEAWQRGNARGTESGRLAARWGDDTRTMKDLEKEKDDG